MCPKWLLFLFFSGFCQLVAIHCQIDFPIETDTMPIVEPTENMTATNWTTTTTVSPLPEESTTPSSSSSDTTTPKVNIEPVLCKTNKDCEIESDDPNIIFICSASVGMCVLGKPVEPELPTTLRPKRTTAAGDHVQPQPTRRPSSTPSPNTGGTETVKNQSDFSNVPVVVWILMVIPFASIIVLGILCGRRLKAQSLNIQENLMRATINGVHVDQLLSQRELLNSLAFSRPPPTYEKATGEIPPSYETFLQALQEKRQSIFNCDSLMTENPDDKETTDSWSINYSGGGSSSGGGSLRSLPPPPPVSHHRTGRGSPLVFAISHTNVP